MENSGCVADLTLRGLSGYWPQKVMRTLKMPPAPGVSEGPKIDAAHTYFLLAQHSCRKSIAICVTSFQTTL
jgi:hypothetical protein